MKSNLSLWFFQWWSNLISNSVIVYDIITSCGKLFQMFIVLYAKECFLISKLQCCFVNFRWCPLVLSVLSYFKSSNIFLMFYTQGLWTVHKGLLTDLKVACVTSPAKISEVFVKWKSKLLIYGDYCSNLPKSQEKIDEVFQDQKLKASVEVGWYSVFSPAI